MGQFSTNSMYSSEQSHEATNNNNNNTFGFSHNNLSGNLPSTSFNGSQKYSRHCSDYVTDISSMPF